MADTIIIENKEAIKDKLRRGESYTINTLVDTYKLENSNVQAVKGLTVMHDDENKYLLRIMDKQKEIYKILQIYK